MIRRIIWPLAQRIMVAPLWVAAGIFRVWDAIERRRPVVRACLPAAPIPQRSMSDRIRHRQAVAEAAQARRQARQAEAHAREFAEAREASHVG